MLKKPYVLAFAGVILLAVVLLNLPARATTQLKLALSGLFLPLFGLLSSSEKALAHAGDQVVPRGLLLEQIERLQKENQRLKLENIQAADVATENVRLRGAVGWNARIPWKLKLARVIARDPANWWRTLVIDVGSADGVRTNAFVMVSEGLVGRVEQVGASSSRVILVGDPNCRVSAMVEETREPGVISPATDSISDPSLVQMTYVSRHTQLRPGQQIITSGLGGVFPKGIIIGQIVDISSAGYGLYQESRVKLAANLRNIEEVWVVLQ